jgi:2-polyprenyl-3-methyl-5-hydroxy-6-metoxy-1,4-benzoquinol methylase
MSNANVQTQEFFHGYAGDFNAIYSNRNGGFTNLVNRTLRKSMRLRYIRSLEGCTPIAGRTVLDVGCGPGHYGIALALRGAAHVTGIDFAEGMIELARRQAHTASVAECCDFLVGDVQQYNPPQPLDYVLVMGVMDYVREPRAMVEHVISMTRRRAFFSFPVGGGLLAWQRKIRYRRRCPLYFYSRADVQQVFAGIDGVSVRIEPIARDFFVTVERTR